MPYFILMTHQKGGVGKSTLTYNLAVNLKNKSNVCIIDMDIQGSLADFREVSPVPIFLKDDLSRLKDSDYDFVFIDTPPYLSERIIELCVLADVIVVPTKAGVFDVLAIRSTIDIIKRSGAEKKAMIVFNMIKPNTTLTSEIKSKVENHDIYISNVLISDLVSFSRSVINIGVSENTKAQSQIESLTEEILKFMSKSI